MDVQESEPPFDPPGHSFIVRAVRDRAAAESCSQAEARSKLREDLAAGKIAAVMMDPQGRLFTVQAHRWNSDESVRWLLGYRAQLTVSDWRPSYAPEQRVPKSWIFVTLPKERAAPSGPTKRKTGPQPSQFDRVRREMVERGDAADLDKMTEVEMETRFRASRDTCRRARAAALSELADQGNSD